MTKIFDTHAHYYDERFNEDRYDLLEHLFKESVCGIINCGADIQTSKECIQLANKYPSIWCSVGIHPQEASNINDKDIEEIHKLCSNNKVVAIGEIGLDYYYDDSCPREKQIEVFIKQLELSKKLDLPVIIHDRDAHEDTLRILKEYRPKGVIHCFSASLEIAKEVINLGMYIGIGGVVTFANAKKLVEVAQNIQLDRLLLETDAPYMTPVPHRGHRCDSSHIIYTASKIAELRGITVDEVLTANIDNVEKVFRIPKINLK